MWRALLVKRIVREEVEGPCRCEKRAVGLVGRIVGRHLELGEGARSTAVGRKTEGESEKKVERVRAGRPARLYIVARVTLSIAKDRRSAVRARPKPDSLARCRWGKFMRESEGKDVAECTACGGEFKVKDGCLQHISYKPTVLPEVELQQLTSLGLMARTSSRPVVARREAAERILPGPHRAAALPRDETSAGQRMAH